ncbi:unnamed protein product [Tenebrio molitor]|jgi:hypothetical protein|nr:unnamed protein product [Tenebrio molitor]
MNSTISTNIKMPRPKHTESNPKCTQGKNYNCDKCRYITKSPVLMMGHIKSLPLEVLNCETSDLDQYCCKNCDFQTNLKIIYNQHIREYHENNIDCLQDQTKKDIAKSYICQECSFETYSVLLWLKHLDSLCFNAREDFEKICIVSYGDGRWYQCINCAFKSKNLTILKKHQTAKHLLNKKEWFCCSYCKYKAKTKNDLKEHINCEHDKCNFTTKRKLKIKQREPLKHSSNKVALRLQCEQCSYKTKWRSCLKLHINRHKSDEEVEWFYCFSCAYKTKRKGHLKQHTIYKHTTSEAVQWFNCDKCQYKFKTKSDLSRHSKQHLSKEDVQWFKCDKCSFKAKQRSNVKAHALVKHTSNKEALLFHCEHCSYTTKLKYNLKRHITRHKSDEEGDWFYCFNCDYKTRTKGTLKQHMFFKHTPSEAVQWFACDKCHFKSKTRSYLSKHAKQHLSKQDM